MKKLLKIKIIVLLALFVVTGTAVFVSMYYRETEPAVTTMTNATLPVVYMQTENGRLINPAYGYITQVNGASLFNGITPLDENRRVTAVIYNYGETITEVSYRVRDMETDSLLEDTRVSSIQTSREYVTASLDIKNLIEKDTQYLLEIVISTPKHEEIVYYERIYWGDNLLADSKLDFVLQFNEYTYDSENLSEISQWIETSGSGDNTNYGLVDIYSTQEQIGWGELGAVVEGDIIPVILEISSSVAQIRLDYRVVTPCTDSVYDTYNVSDYYRIRQVSEDVFYLLSYEREADQIFDGNEDLQASGRINLGIKSSHEGCEALSDSAGNYSYFVDSGQLWCYSRENNKFTNVFSFRPADFNGFDRQYEDHEMRLLSVNDQGDAVFLVYGYMGRGEHEGELGISLYQYAYEENVVREKIFIPLSASCDVIRESVGDIAYISEEQFYIKIGSCLYSIDLLSNEVMVVTDALYEGTYCVNEDGTRLAYHYNHTAEDEVRIRIIDFTDGTEYFIDVDEYGNNRGYDRIRVIGYINGDMVFGICDSRDITTMDGVNMIFPMYGIYILSDEYELVKSYMEDDIYVTKAYINGMRVNLTRVMREEDGGFVSTSIDQLMNRKENNQQSGLYTEVVTTSARQKELYLNLPSSAGRTDTVSLRYAKEVTYDAGTSLMLSDNLEAGVCYYAYGHGNCMGIFTDLAEAVKTAAGNEGFVLNAAGNYVWCNTHLLNTIIWNDMYAEWGTEKFGLNLTGVSLDDVLYFVSAGRLVMACVGENQFVIIYDYDNNNVYYYDSQTSELVTASREDAEMLFAEWGNVFLTTE